MAQLPTVTQLRHVCQIGALQATRELSDEQLLACFITGHDTQAFESLVQRHGPLVLGVCRRVLGDGPDAEDAFQATFLVLMRKAGVIVHRERLPGWLHAVAFRVASRARVDLARRHRSEARAPVRPSADPLDELTARELCAAIDGELARLPECYRAALLLCLLEGKTRDEAAVLLGWSLATLKRRLQRGRELLSARLARRGVALPAALSGALLLGGPASARVPAALVLATRAAAGRWASGDVPGRAAVLAEGLLRSLLLVKVKKAAGVLLLAMLMAGAVVWRQAWPLAAASTAGQPLSLAAPPPTAIEPDTPTDPLPRGAFARLGTARFRHFRAIHALAWHPDGKALATAGWGSEIVLWDSATGREVRRLAGHKGAVFALAFSPRGKRLLSGGDDGTLRLWDADTGKPIHVFTGHNGAIRSVAFAPDGKLVASAGTDRVVRLWSSDGRSEPTVLKGHAGEVRALAFAPVGKLLASGGDDRTVRLWSWDSGRTLHELGGHTAAVFGLAFARDGKELVSGAADWTVRLWDVSKGKEVRQMRSQGGVTAVAFAPDGKTLAWVGNDTHVRLWDRETGRPRWAVAGHRVEIHAVAFSPDGKALASGSVDSTVRFWNTATGKEKQPLTGHHGWVDFVSFLPDGRTVVSASAHDRDVCLWDLPTARLRQRFGGHQALTHAVALGAGGKRLASSGHDGALYIQEMPGGRVVRKIVGSSRGALRAIALAPDGRLVAAADPDFIVHVWEVATGKERGRLAGHTKPIRTLVFAPNSRTLVSAGEDHTIRTWDGATGKPLRQWSGDGQPIESLVVSGDGRLLASGSRSGPVRLWDLATGQMLRQSADRMGWVVGLTFSPDGKTLASGDGSFQVRLWEVETMAERGRFVGHRDGIHSLAFSPDSRILVSASIDTTLLAWDVTGLRGAGPVRQASANVLRSRWEDLGDADGVKAYAAMWKLATSPGSTKWLKEQLRPVLALDRKRFAQLVGDLDDDNFKVRVKATEELETLGDGIVPLLRKVLRERISAEVRWRVEYLLEQLGKETPQRRRQLRAVEALEHAGSAEAGALLKVLAGGEREARLTREATAALKRLAR